MDIHVIYHYLLFGFTSNEDGVNMKFRLYFCAMYFQRFCVEYFYCCNLAARWFGWYMYLSTYLIKTSMNLKL